jgi:hypothetical protein
MHATTLAQVSFFSLLWDSAVMGADDGATSHFNFFKHYRPDVVGGSTGAHFWQLPGMVRVGALSSSLFFFSLTLCCGVQPYRDSDQLNAAFSDAASINLITQIEYASAPSAPH